MENDAVSEFCKVTGTDATKARHYLEASNWDSNLAMSNYFEEAEDEPEIPPPSSFPHPGSPKPAAPRAPSSRIATFANLAKEEEDEEEGQAFYAGGSERSGQQVLGPGKRKAGNQIVEEMFKSVRKFGGEVQDTPDNRSSTSTLKPFRGSGHILGSTSSEPPEVLPGAEGADSEVQEMQVRLQLWQTGFTVDDGEMRDYQEPENKEFLAAIRKGEIPMELRQRAQGKQVHLSVEDHSHEEYAPKKTQLQAFSGAGFRLGNVTPVVRSESGPSAEKSTSDAQEGLKVDQSQPVTSIQIRLADGSRLVMQANPSHTIGDVRSFIVQARPEYEALLFSLMTAFPPKELTNDSASLEEENLLNAVIVQKLK